MMEGRQQQLTQPGLFIGGLRNDLHPANLAGLICALLRKFQVGCEVILFFMFSRWVSMFVPKYLYCLLLFFLLM